VADTSRWSWSARPESVCAADPLGGSAWRRRTRLRAGRGERAGAGGRGRAPINGARLAQVRIDLDNCIHEMMPPPRRFACPFTSVHDGAAGRRGPPPPPDAHPDEDSSARKGMLPTQSRTSQISLKTQSLSINLIRYLYFTVKHYRVQLKMRHLGLLGNRRAEQKGSGAPCTQLELI